MVRNMQHFQTREQRLEDWISRSSKFVQAFCSIGHPGAQEEAKDLERVREELGIRATWQLESKDAQKE